MSGEKTVNEVFVEACTNGEEAKVNAAIVLGVDVNTKDATYDMTGLMLAIRNKHENIVDILLAHPDIDINEKSNSGFFPLLVAALNGLTSIVAKLGRMPALRGVNDQGYGSTPLSRATINGRDNQSTVGERTIHNSRVLVLIQMISFFSQLPDQLKTEPNEDDI